jgi:hypothetical protein
MITLGVGDCSITKGQHRKTPIWDPSRITTLQGAASLMKPGVYINFMSGDEQDRVPEAYQERWDRMVAVKSHYDPNNFFRLNQNVPPLKLAAKSS